MDLDTAAADEQSARSGSIRNEGDGVGAARLRSLTHLLLCEEPRYSQQEVARLAGVELRHVKDLWRALGFATPDPCEVMFTDSDVEALRIAVGLPEAAAVASSLPLARAFGQSIARMTEWQADLLLGPTSHD